VLDELPQTFDAPGLLPSVSSVMLRGTESFFERLKEIKDRHYGGGRFQLQYSIHSTDPATRAVFVPKPVLDFEWMGRFGERFREPGDQRITLNFAAARDVALEPEKLRSFFDPEHFIIKLTPLNPTDRVMRSGLASEIDPERPETGQALVDRFERAGYPVILSIGETEENAIGSNCGQYITCLRQGEVEVRAGYTSARYS
jgi:23S rRNA (adenine2503-C2)-methyltransferase